MPHVVNMTWVTLIPKFEGALGIADNRPISMVGSLYKVISKILANKLKKVTSKLVGEAQTTFISGRQILDGALIVCETVQWLKKVKTTTAVIKLNFHKVYDMVSWNFVDLILESIGFGERWR